ncbi:MAG: dihydroneopterin aldolase [Acidimicrobiales bacterium]
MSDTSPDRSMPSDVIELRGLRALGFCGALPEEQVRAQPFEVDLDVEADLARPGRTDQLDDTLDYGAIAHAVEQVIATERFSLLERLSARIAETVLADPRALAVTVTVRKLRPPVPQHLETSGVRIRRTR